MNGIATLMISREKKTNPGAPFSTKSQLIKWRDDLSLRTVGVPKVAAAFATPFKILPLGVFPMFKYVLCLVPTVVLAAAWMSMSASASTGVPVTNVQLVYETKKGEDPQSIQRARSIIISRGATIARFSELADLQ